MRPATAQASAVGESISLGSLAPLGTVLSLLLAAGAAFAQQSAAAASSPSLDDLKAGAAAARDSNDVPRAIQLYAQAEELEPKWAAGWWSLGLLQYSSRNWTAARDAFTYYIGLTPERGVTAAQATALRGLCEFETGEYQRSLADVKEGIALGATNDRGNQMTLRYREAMLLTRLGRFEESLKLYTALAQSGASSQLGSEFSLALGLAGLRSPQLPGEVPAVQRSLFFAAGDATLRFDLGDSAGARAAFASLFQDFPGTPNAHYLYGYLLLPEDPAATIAEYKLELEVAPSNITADAMLAWVLLSEERPSEALDYARKAVAEAPQFPIAQLVLGQSLAGTGDLAGAIEHLEKALQLQPGYLETHVALATAYARSGRSQDARRERLRSLSMAQESVAAP